jgi:hypothetical protein
MEYDEEFFMTRYEGVVDSRYDEAGNLTHDRETLMVDGSVFMVARTDDPAKKCLKKTTENRSYRIDLKDTSDPVFGQIAAKLAETTPMVARAIQVLEEREANQEPPADDTLDGGV